MTQTENVTQAEATPAPVAIPLSHYGTLAPGEIRTFAHVTTTGRTITVRLFHVAGGCMVQLDVRSNGGRMPERCGNYVFDADALRDYIATLRWLVQQ